MGWKEYWEDLITKRKLRNVIAQINEIDMDKNGKCSIEEICHNIYNDYNDYANDLETVRQELLKIIEKFPGVHLQTSRVKELDTKTSHTSNGNCSLKIQQYRQSDNKLIPCSRSG